MEQVAGLLIFLLLGLATPARAALRQFHYVDQRKTWTEAQTYCRDKFTDLATICTQDDWTIVSQMIANGAYPYAWLGLYNDVKSWRWSLDNTSLYYKGLGSWFNLTADNSDGDERCVSVYNGQLDDCNCESTLGSVCYDETTYSYITVPEPMSWQPAQTYCREHYTDLASIRDQQELNAIISATDPNGHYWMGLSRQGWKWSDQSDSSFRRWAPGEPNLSHDACGAAAVNGWYDRSSASKYPFICSAAVRPSKVLKITVKTHGSVNLNDPLVQEAIVKQMEKDLRGQGLTQEFRLSWRKQLHGHVFNKTEL